MFREASGGGAEAARSLLLKRAWQDVWEQVLLSRDAHGGQALIESLLPLANPLARLLQLGFAEGLLTDVGSFIDDLLDDNLPIDLPVGVLAVSIRLWMNRQELVVSTEDDPVTGKGASGRRTGRKKRASLQKDREAARWMDQAIGLINAHPSSGGALAYLKPLHQQVVARLNARLAQPERAPDDWSIPFPGTPQGELGSKLMAFLNDPSGKRLVWPLAKERRMAIHRFIDRHELPITHVTERTGSPHKLILEKQSSLHAREADQRWRWEQDFRNLSRLAGIFDAA